MKLSRVSAVLTAAALAPAILFPSAASATGNPPAGPGVSAADSQTDEQNKDLIKAMLADPKEGPGIREAARAALDGTPEDRVAFLTVKQHSVREDDERVKLTQLMSTGGPAVRAGGGRAMSGDRKAVQEFLATGYEEAKGEDLWHASRIAGTAGPLMRKAADEALRSGYAEVAVFLNSGQHKAASAERVTVSQLAETGGPAVRKAALAAAEGSYADVAAFLNSGHAKALATDEAAEKKAAEDKAAAEKAAREKKAAVVPANVTTTPAPATTPATTQVTTDSTDRLAYTGGGEDLPWQVGGAAAALAAGAALVAASRRRQGAEG